jgi:hypothetical protein
MMEAREPEEPFARDPLARRLEQIGDLPMSRDLLPRVLSGAHAMKCPRRRFRDGRVLAGTLVVLVAVVAATPVTLGYVGQLIEQMGLRQTPAGLASVSGYGQTLRVTTGIDDGREVMVDLHADPATPASGWSDFGDITAQDASGRDLVASGWQGNTAAQGGEEAMVWFERSAGGAAAGTPITLHVAALQGPGQWTLRFSIPASSAPTSLPVPAPGKVGGVAVTFTDVRASDSYIMVGADLVGPSEQAIWMVSGPTALQDPSGGHVPNAHEADSDEAAVTGGVREHAEWFWPRQGSGTYKLIVGNTNGPGLVRAINIP